MIDTPSEYSKYEETYWWSIVRREIISFLLDPLFNNNFKIEKTLVIDLGCGSGANLKFLKKFGKTIGLEHSPYELKKAKEKANGRLILGDAAILPLKNNAFSLISLQDVIEHCYVPDQVMKEVWRISKPGSIVIITVPAYQFLYNPIADEDHRKRYSAKEVRTIVEEAGFEVIKLSYFNTFLFPLMLIQRLLQKYFFNGVGRHIFPKYPNFLGGFFGAVFRLEKTPLKYISLPFGGSVLCICKKQ